VVVEGFYTCAVLSWRRLQYPELATPSFFKLRMLAHRHLQLGRQG